MFPLNNAQNLDELKSLRQLIQVNRDRVHYLLLRQTRLCKIQLRVILTVQNCKFVKQILNTLTVIIEFK